jgi:nucleotide-binding universal stress UspA family protein
MTIRTILVPVDYSPHSRAAVQTALEFAGGFRARLVLLKVLEPLHVVFGELFPSQMLSDSERRARADSRMKELTSSIDVPVEGLVLEGPAWSTICEFAQKESIDLIVISSHGYHGLRRLVLGSTAERVVRHAPCSVLVVKPADKPESSGTPPADSPR